MERKIVFLISSPPYSTMNNYEALRTSLSLINHDLTVLWARDGVHYPILGSDKSRTMSLVTLAKDMNIKLRIDGYDLESYGYTSKDIIPEVQVISHEDVIDLLFGADVVINF